MRRGQKQRRAAVALQLEGRDRECRELGGCNRIMVGIKRLWICAERQRSKRGGAVGKRQLAQVKARIERQTEAVNSAREQGELRVRGGVVGGDAVICTPPLIKRLIRRCCS
jgi:hypothetical protein